MAGDGFRLRFVDDPAPQQVAVVRRECVDLFAVLVEREREVLVFGDPEVAVEAALQIRGLLLEVVGERDVFQTVRARRAARILAS